MQNNENLCAVCGNAAKKRCGSCQVTYYCTREHQKSDWKTHSKICRPYKLVENAQIGRHYVATRNIKIGEVVMYEKAPLVTGPNYPVFETFDGVVTKCNSPVCLNCYIELTAGNAKPCRKCGWPLCTKCETHGNECGFTVKYRKSKVKIRGYEEHHPMYEAIMIVRALALKDTDPKAYRKLLNLEHHCNEIMTQPSIFKQPKQIAKMVKSFFNIKDIEEAEIAKIFGIIQINAQIIPTTKPPHAAIYDVSSYIEHNCRANCSKTFTDEGGLIIWAAVPISKGDHITSGYLDFRWGAVKRRKYLATTKFFDCKCERCKDPTEFGTMFNALKCHKEECDGCMLPPTFLVTEENYPDFVCSKCSATAPWKSVQRTDAIISKEWINMNKSDVSQCEIFFAKWKKVLHENHFYIVGIEIDLAYEIGLRGSPLKERSDKCLTDLVQLCKKLTNLVRTLAPAENRVRGILLFIQFSAMEELYTRIEPEGLDEKLKCVEEAKKMLDETYKLLHREPASFRLENSIARCVLDEIMKIESLSNLLRKVDSSI